MLHCVLDQAFFKHLVSLLTFVLSCFQPGPIQMLESWTRVWFQIDVKLDYSDSFQALVLHAREIQ